MYSLPEFKIENMFEVIEQMLEKKELLRSVRPQPSLPSDLDSFGTEQPGSRIYWGLLPLEKSLDVKLSDSSESQEFVYSVQDPSKAFRRRTQVTKA